MGVIVARPHSVAVSGAGAYTISEKLAIEMEQEFIAVEPYAFKELTYNNQKQLTNVSIWEDNTKTIKLFNKDLTYNSQKQLTQTYLTRVSDGAKLLRLFSYDVQKQLTSVETSGSY